jgi:hypothetical protein
LSENKAVYAEGVDVGGYTLRQLEHLYVSSSSVFVAVAFTPNLPLHLK